MIRDSHLSVRLSQEEREALERLAREERLPVGQLVRRLLAPHLATPPGRRATRRVSEGPAADPLRVREQRWLREHPEEVAHMAGEWAVLEGDRLVAHGADYVRVLEEAERVGIRIPFIVRIPERRPRDVYFIGF